MADQQRPHAFVLPFPVQGHILPLMNFCKLLARKYGFIISFLNSEENHKRMTQSTQTAHEEAGGEGIRMLWLPDSPPSAEEMSQYSEGSRFLDKSHVHLTKTFLNTDPDALEKLIREQSSRVTCLILDVNATMVASAELCEKLGIPRLLFFTASAASLCMTARGAEVDGDKEQMTSIPGAPPLHVSDVNQYLSACGRLGSDFMFRFFTWPISLLADSDVIVVNTFEELEAPTLQFLREKKRMRVWAIGPVLPPSFTGALGAAPATLWPEEHGCLEWLDRQPPASVLFVSFGSLATFSSAQLLELALGLEASQQRILWVTRPDQIYGDTPQLPHDFIDRIRNRVFVVSWAPQLQVLGHPSVGGFLTHCGWNSTMESISAGVPMLAWPFFGDQMLNCRFIVDTWRVGLSTRRTITSSDSDSEDLIDDGRHVVGREEVEKAVRALMEGGYGNEVRKNARTHRDAALRALREGGSSYHNLHLAIHEAFKIF